MPPRRAPRWSKRFLRALGRSGNVRLACGEARACRKACYALRRSDPQFSAAWQAAIDRAGARLCEGREGSRPPAGRRFVQGQEMQVIGGHGAIPPRLIAVSARRWSQAKEAAFLSTLAGSAHVRLSARAAGVTASACYAHRKRRPTFARAWEQAIDIGVCQLESQLLAQTIASVSGERPVEPAQTPPLTDFFGALSLLHWHRKQRGQPREAPPLDLDEVAPSIESKVRAILYKRVKGEMPKASRAAILARIAEIQAADGEEDAED